MVGQAPRSRDALWWSRQAEQAQCTLHKGGCGTCLPTAIAPAVSSASCSACAGLAAPPWRLLEGGRPRCYLESCHHSSSCLLAHTRRPLFLMGTCGLKGRLRVGRRMGSWNRACRVQNAARLLAAAQQEVHSRADAQTTRQSSCSPAPCAPHTQPFTCDTHAATAPLHQNQSTPVSGQAPRSWWRYRAQRSYAPAKLLHVVCWLLSLASSKGTNRFCASAGQHKGVGRARACWWGMHWIKSA